MNCIEAYPDSTAVKHILYEPSSKKLFLMLARNRLYCYFDVPQQVVRNLISAPSVGRYFAANIVMFRCEGLESDDPEYLRLKGLSIGRAAAVVSENYGQHRTSCGDFLFVQETRVGEWCDSTSRHQSSQSGLPFFLEPLKDEDLYPDAVKRIQSMFRVVVKSYTHSVDVASPAAIRSHDQLLRYIPASARDYLKSILNGINVIIDVRNPRRSKAGDCRVDREHRIAYVTINENLNKFKMLCVLLHEIAHVLDFSRSAPHDVVWKCLYGCLLADMYAFFPEKYRKEVEWMMVYAPAATRENNFGYRGILSGCSCEIPPLFYGNSIDVKAESEDYSRQVQEYALHASFEVMKLLLEDGAEGLISKLSGKLARAVIVGNIENEDSRAKGELQRISDMCAGQDTEYTARIVEAIKHLSDMLLRCWVKYNPLNHSHVCCFDRYYMGGNPWIDELITLVTLK